MKFSDGAWKWAQGVTPTFARCVTEHRVAGDTLTCFALDRHIRWGVDKFEGLVLRVAVTSPGPDIIRVRVGHFHVDDAQHFGFDLAPPRADTPVSIEESDDELVFTTGQTSLRIARADWSIRFERGRELITAGGPGSLAHMAVDGRGGYLTQQLDLAIGECIYGLGERFGPLVKNGQTVDIWQRDGGTISEQAYKNVPFYVSNRGYGLLVNHPGKVEFEVATERVSKVQFAVPGEVMDYVLFNGPDPMGVLEKYTDLTGKPALPPAWSFGLWLSTSFTTDYNEQTVMEFVDGMEQRGIPLSVFHFDCFWMKQRHWCNFLWDRDAFPDPEGMLKRLKERGLKTCVWINPYISSMSELFEEGVAGGYFLKHADGSVYQVDQWQPGMAIVDFTNPDATAWYLGKLQTLLDMGVDAFKTDFGERIPTDVVYHNGADPGRMHNYYAYLYNQAVFGLLEKHHGKNDAVVFARAATAGCQKFPVHWGGDCEATFESMAQDLRGGLSFCMSGNAFWSHDIGGFAGKADPAVFKRWLAFGLLSTHSRLHGSESYRVPWLYDDEAVDVARHFTRLKNRLFPYLFAAAQEAHETGRPMMRAMVLAYPNDPACLHLDRQYLLGRSLMVAPIFNHEHLAEYYLPHGVWTALERAGEEPGGRFVRERHGFLSVPIWVPENSLLPMADASERPSWSLDEPLTLHAFALRDSEQVTARAATEVPGVGSTFTATRAGRRFEFESDGQADSVAVLLRGVSGEVDIVNGEADAASPLGLCVRWSDTSRPLSVSALPAASESAPPLEAVVKPVAASPRRRSKTNA